MKGQCSLFLGYVQLYYVSVTTTSDIENESFSFFDEVCGWLVCLPTRIYRMSLLEITILVFASVTKLLPFVRSRLLLLLSQWIELVFVFGLLGDYFCRSVRSRTDVF